VRDAARQARAEIASFLLTARDFTLAPARFADEWANDRRRALNPLGFLATAFAVVGPAQALALHLLHGRDDGGALLANALGAILPFVYYLALGALQHLVLRLFGSRRTLADSCAMALYAGGGPAAAATLICFAGACAWFRLTGSAYIDLHARWQWPTAVLLVGMFAYVFVTLAAALARLHGVRAWQAVVAGTFALAVSGGRWAMAMGIQRGDIFVDAAIGPRSHRPDVWIRPPSKRYPLDSRARHRIRSA
jgi:hypothetical protein